jgi:hypothetical protein
MRGSFILLYGRLIALLILCCQGQTILLAQDSSHKSATVEGAKPGQPLSWDTYQISPPTSSSRASQLGRLFPQAPPLVADSFKSFFPGTICAFKNSQATIFRKTESGWDSTATSERFTSLTEAYPTPNTKLPISHSSTFELPKSRTLLLASIALPAMNARKTGLLLISTDSVYWYYPPRYDSLYFTGGRTLTAFIAGVPSIYLLDSLPIKSVQSRAAFEGTAAVRRIAFGHMGTTPPSGQASAQTKGLSIIIKQQNRYGIGDPTTGAETIPIGYDSISTFDFSPHSPSDTLFSNQLHIGWQKGYGKLLGYSPTHLISPPVPIRSVLWHNSTWVCLMLTNGKLHLICPATPTAITTLDAAPYPVGPQAVFCKRNNIGSLILPSGKVLQTGISSAVAHLDLVKGPLFYKKANRWYKQSLPDLPSSIQPNLQANLQPNRPAVWCKIPNLVQVGINSQNLQAFSSSRGKFGYIDSAGYIRISERYTQAEPFSGGPAPVARVCIAGKPALITPSETFIFQPKYKTITPLTASQMSWLGVGEGGSPVLLRYYSPTRGWESFEADSAIILPFARIAIKKKGYWGVIDTVAAGLIPPLYQQIRPAGQAYFIVRQGIKEGIATATNMPLLPPKAHAIRYEPVSGLFFVCK